MVKSLGNKQKRANASPSKTVKSSGNKQKCANASPSRIQYCNKSSLDYQKNRNTKLDRKTSSQQSTPKTLPIEQTSHRKRFILPADRQLDSYKNSPESSIKLM